jgi:hypothetical protein
LAGRAARTNAAMRRDSDLDLLGKALAIDAQANVLVNKSARGLYLVQEGFNV